MAQSGCDSPRKQGAGCSKLKTKCVVAGLTLGLLYKPLFWDEGSQRKEELGEKRKHRWVSQLPQEGKAVGQLKPGPGQLHRSQDLEREDRLSLKFTAFSGK